MVKQPKPRTAFRLYVEPDRRALRRFYYEVKIFSTKDKMQTYVACNRERLGFKGHPNVQAITCSWTMRKLRGGRWHTSSKVGEILFYQESIAAGIVAHECAHAMLHWSITKKFSERFKRHSAGEERMCWVLGSLVRQFWVKFWERWPRGLR